MTWARARLVSCPLIEGLGIKTGTTAFEISDTPNWMVVTLWESIKLKGHGPQLPNNRTDLFAHNPIPASQQSVTRLLF